MADLEVAEREAAERPAPSPGRIDWRLAAPWVVFLAVFGAYPVVFRTPYLHNVGVVGVLYALMAVGWNMLGGFTGQISLGHAMFFGIGAYASAVGGAHLGTNAWLNLLAGMAAAVLLALALGWPVFRLRGHYFAIATIALGEILRVVFLNWQWVGGAAGLSVPLLPDSLADLQFSGRLKWEYYYLALAFLVAALAVTWAIRRSRTGYYLVAIREDDKAAAGVGIPVTSYKQVAFAFSAAAVAAAGSLYAQFVLFVDPPSTLALIISIQISIAAILGGVRSMWGPVIGAVVFMALTEGTRLAFGGGGDALNLVIYGLLVMVIAAFEPNGLIGLTGRAGRLAGRWAR